MTGQPTLKQVLDRMNRAIAAMEEAVASKAEQEWAQTNGVMIHHWLAPLELMPITLEPRPAGGV